MISTPVLLIIFNRPDTTQQVFNAIRAAAPAQLFIAADGPRSNRPGEKEKCELARSIAQQVDWECEVKTRFLDENVGCNMGVTGAISWFFEHVEAGIVLEDDCVPHPDFWQFMGELLHRYQHDNRIKIVGGNNFHPGKVYGDGSYYFTSITYIWGWATWRRTWNEYDFNVAQNLPVSQANQLITERFSDKSAIQFWKKLFRYIREGRPVTWDYRLTFSTWSANGVSIAPNVNLVTNIGFNAEATTGKDADSSFAKRSVEGILPLRHPSHTERNEEADTYFFQHFLKGTLDVKGLKNKLEELLPWKLRKKITGTLKSLFKK